MKPSPFSTLPIPKSLQDNLEQLGYEFMTDIQAQSLPTSIDGRDLIGKAKTGSGKTAAFAIPMLLKLNIKSFRIQGLVLCPTRELATQVAEEIRKLARFTQNVKVLTLCGGSPVAPQRASLERGAHIVVGTPGRLVDHIGKGNLKLGDLQTLVLDEADRMLEMGFMEDVSTITEQTPASRQTLLFSATFPEKLDRFSQSLLNAPVQVEVTSTETAVNIEQYFYQIDRNERENDLIGLLGQYQPSHCVIFCHTKQGVNDLTNTLRQQGYQVLPLQGDMEQRQRDETLIRFSNRSVSILVATDVAARGLDIDDLEMVINYDLPRDAAIYTHRIGRTGRAGKSGIAVSLYTDSEQYKLDAILSERKEANIHMMGLGSIDYQSDAKPLKPAMKTICIDAGKKNKIRPGDIVGAITANPEFTAQDIGKIAVQPFVSYVAVDREMAKLAIKTLNEGRIKGKKIKAKLF